MRAFQHSVNVYMRRGSFCAFVFEFFFAHLWLDLVVAVHYWVNVCMSLGGLGSRSLPNTFLFFYFLLFVFCICFGNQTAMVVLDKKKGGDVVDKIMETVHHT